MIQVYIISFLITCTILFIIRIYGIKSDHVHPISAVESDIQNRAATTGDYIIYLFVTIFGALIFWKVHLPAAIITIIYTMTF